MGALRFHGVNGDIVIPWGQWGHEIGIEIPWGQWGHEIGIEIPWCQWGWGIAIIGSMGMEAIMGLMGAWNWHCDYGVNGDGGIVIIGSMGIGMGHWSMGMGALRSWGQCGWGIAIPCRFFNGVQWEHCDHGWRWGIARRFFNRVNGGIAIPWGQWGHGIGMHCEYEKMLDEGAKRC
ncbi:hypothetical protein AMTR_s00138p00066010 [Amborella trichopoda]|uniref:Uncharacterized protein n=1 Tax=Amborella trichopoda TaxID=13333 RepID=W1NEJ5_AMBTC|nr:hypothetical protein AMTR_s00138p00066010 [Amborella trichopoda]